MQRLVSVIMAAYNAEKYIKESIQSVIDQIYQNWELIIINDGSTDGTSQIINQYNDSRILYYFQNNQGVSAARNLGLSKMKGEYFCFLDADDFLPQKSISSRLEVFESDDSITYVDGAVQKWNNNMSKQISDWTPLSSENLLNELVSLSGNVFFGPTWMIKYDHNQSYVFDKSMTHGEDLLFYIELAKKGGIYSYTNSVILKYRVHTNSAMTNLIGLGDGYRKITQKLIKLNFPKKEVLIFKNKTKSIMLKSFISNWDFWNGFKYYLELP